MTNFRLNTKNKFLNRLEVKKTKAELKAYGMVRMILRDRCWITTNKVRQNEKGKKFYLDIYIKELRLGIELDGGVHKDRIDKDLERDISLMEENKALMIIRFPNEVVLDNKKKHDFIKIVRETISLRVIYFLNNEKYHEILKDFLLKWFRIKELDKTIQEKTAEFLNCF